MPVSRTTRGARCWSSEGRSPRGPSLLSLCLSAFIRCLSSLIRGLSSLTLCQGPLPLGVGLSAAAFKLSAGGASPFCTQGGGNFGIAGFIFGALSLQLCICSFALKSSGTLLSILRSKFCLLDAFIDFAGLHSAFSLCDFESILRAFLGNLGPLFRCQNF